MPSEARITLEGCARKLLVVEWWIVADGESYKNLFCDDAHCPLHGRLVNHFSVNQCIRDEHSNILTPSVSGDVLWVCHGLTLEVTGATRVAGERPVDRTVRCCRDCNG